MDAITPPETIITPDAPSLIVEAPDIGESSIEQEVEYPNPDTAQLGRFTAALFKHADPKGFVSLRAFRDDKEEKDEKPIFINPISIGDPQFLAVVVERTRQAANSLIPAVFAPPVVTFKTGRDAKTENILEGVAISVECDKTPAAAQATLRELLGDPTIIVVSGGEWTNTETGEVEPKVHIHWRLKTPTKTKEQHELLREVRNLAAQLVGGDHTAIPLVHPLRWPGSWHRKKEPPRLAQIAFESDNELDLADALVILREAVGGMSIPESKTNISPGKKKLTADRIEDVVAALSVIPNDNREWKDWNDFGLAIWGATGGNDEGGKAFADWSAKASKNNPETTAARWKHYTTSPPTRIGFGTLVYHARKACPSWTFGSGDASSLPIIYVKGGELSKLSSRGEEILHAAGVQIFQRSRQLVRPVIEEVDATRGRKTKICQLIPIVPDYLRDLLCRNAHWLKFDRRSMKNVAIDPPRGIAATILVRTGEWQLFPAVYGVTSSPTMRPDGSLLMEPGFDHRTGLLLVEPPPMPAIPQEPSKVDAEAALKLLEDLLVGFPFVDDVARAGALSALITAVARGAFPVTPLHASRAPTAGSGKSFLWDIVAGIISGHPMPVISTGKDEIEMEKRLGAALMTGQPLISIDNISGELGGDALCQIIERPVVDIRVLGESRNMRIEARGTSVYATGNNFTLVGDICRRVITINLDAGVERPELRQFEFDPIECVLVDRGKYIAAALIVCRAYFCAGRPDKAPKLASFEGWSDTVRSALIWLGRADPVKSMESARQDDPELIELGEMLEAWSEVMGTGEGSRVKLADVLLRCESMSREDQDSDLAPTYPRLNAAMKVVGQRYLARPCCPMRGSSANGCNGSRGVRLPVRNS
jgi:putative DNA primase/helicase